MGQKKWLGIVCLMTAASIWGGMYVVSKYVLLFSAPFVVLWLRYMIAFCCLLPIMVFSNNNKIRREDIPLIGWLGFTGFFISNGFGFVGTQLTTAHMGTLISAAAPAFVIIFAYWLLKEKLTLKKVISVIVASLGMLIIIGFDLEGGGFGTVGKLFLLTGAFGWALYNVYVKQASVKYSPLVISTYATLAALLITTPFMIWQLDSNVYLLFKNPSLWIGILYLGIMSTAVAFFLWNKGMKHMDAGIGSMFYFFTPLVGTICGWIFLREHLSLNFFFGGVLIILGASLPWFNIRSSEII